MSQTSKKMQGLRVVLDRLVYYNDSGKLNIGEKHVFVYFITIYNLSQKTVTLNGRRWIIQYEDSRKHIIDGDGIVGKEPVLATGETFTYNSYHATSCNCQASGSFHGTTASGAAVHVCIPTFHMKVPSDTENGSMQDIRPA